MRVYNRRMDTEKRSRGRPAKPADELLVNYSLRVSLATKAKIDLHGQKWARDALDKAKPPKAKPPKD